ncbi:hypothetical protein VTN77DRAFT_1199 [Rasamsonia byssochlamydoides]|uniref:uncharacterized protein n=1 Tax=Rasamsonia byssochlamydoides TaxID=89139 RepID=UPI003742D9AE
MVDRQRQRPRVDLDFTLRRVFGKTSFRPLQREVILAAIEGHDVFLQAATSFGKSLCFQLPAVVSHGVTIVVSPLLALMMDQVAALKANGIPVATINSTTPPSERQAILEDLLSGHPKTRLLYVTPEFCETNFFRRHLLTIHAQGELNRIAIDEAHCISEWGHDFRPAYKELSWFKKTLKSVKITALTATATPRVRLDIINLLGLDPKTLKTFNTPSARPNIHYEVKYLTDFACDPTVAADFQIQDILSWLKSIQSRREARLKNSGSDLSKLPPISGIIYVPLRSVAESVARALSSSGNNIFAVAYHAGLSNSDRNRIQSMWTSKTPFPVGDNQVTPSFSIIVATSAFGMGIDNPHVRFVIHWTPPRSFEGFVQESGRAGRDGRAAVSVVYYNLQERDRVLERVQRDDVPDNKSRRRAPQSPAAKERSKQARLESFQKVIKYCETTTRCRHEIIKEFSGDLDLEMMGSTQESLGDSKTGDSKTADDASSGFRSSPCDFACDFCKEGAEVLTKRKEEMIKADENTEKYAVYQPMDPTMALLQMMYRQGPYSRQGMRSAGPDPFPCEQCL